MVVIPTSPGPAGCPAAVAREAVTACSFPVKPGPLVAARVTSAVVAAAHRDSMNMLLLPNRPHPVPKAKPELTGSRTITSADKCDSCGAPAYVRADLPTGSLMFCAHHYTRFQSSLAPLALTVVDERSWLTESRR